MPKQSENVWSNKSSPSFASRGTVESTSSIPIGKHREKSSTENVCRDAAKSGYSNLQRFGVISKEHQRGIAEKLEQLKNTLGEEATDSDEEDNVPHKEEIFRNILTNYNSLAGGDAEKVKDFLGNASMGSTCLICISSLKRADPVWNCDNCSSTFHLGCIQKWAKDGIIITSETLSDEHFPNKERFWACPKCRFEYRTHDSPQKYFCYCKKLVDPIDDPWKIPHSCGQICEKTLRSCDHKCCLLCHPGPCPPCPAQSRVTCFCGKQQKVMRCGAHPWECLNVCGKGLRCGNHYCTENCHGGDCAACVKKATVQCVCGADISLQNCGTKDYHCKRVCGKSFSCGIHHCEQVCHSGNCGPCPRSLPRSCPCGKTETVTDCAAEITPCSNICGKRICDLHFCQELCHFGNCGKCMVPVKKTCKCKAKTKNGPCSEDVTCDIKCKRLRNCQRHACNKRCCMGNCPPCDQICGRILSCRTHKCDSLCHSGPCYPCSQVVEISCNCGATKTALPCGRQRSAKPPKCAASCQRPPDCHHKERVKHSCHFGKCPPCSQICNRNLPCHHYCQAKCHSAVEVLTECEVPAGPWEVQREPIKEIREFPCPPCEQLVRMSCLGGHDEAFMRCYEKRIVSCGRACGRKLECGNHLCSIPCHSPDEDCESCSSSCTVQRSCGHPCYLPCHPGECPPCPEIVRIKCHCESMTLKLSCGKFSGLTEEEKRNTLSCKIQCPTMLSCGHPCIMPCHPKTEPHSLIQDCRKKVSMKCPCGRIKEQQQCNKITSGYKLDCTSECLTLIEAKKEQELRIAQEAVENKIKADKELQEQYDRRMQGRKRRRNRNDDNDEEDKSFLSRNRKLILFSAVSVLIAAFLMHCFQVF